MRTLAVMKWFRGTRLRTKLLGTYVALGLFITLLVLFGARYVERETEKQNASRLELSSGTWEVMSLVNGAFEEGFSFALTGDAGEQTSALGRIAAATVRLHQLASLPRLTDDDTHALEDLIQRASRLREVALGFVRTSPRTDRVARAEYDAYEAAFDGMVDGLAKLRQMVQNENALATAQATRTLGWLTVLIGLSSVAIALIAGNALARRLTLPLVALRERVQSFSVTHLGAKLESTGLDEVGDLVVAYDEMAAATARHIDRVERGQERLRDIFGSIEDVLLVIDDEGVISAANPACCRLSGYAEAEVVGRKVSDLFIEKPSAEHEPAPAGVDRAPLARGESVLRTKDGRDVPTRLGISRLRGNDRDGWVCIGEDLTERRRLEADVRQAHKMEAIGRLAGGVAHDFNNMLCIILGYAESLIDGLEPGDPLYEPIAEIKRAGERSADLTRQLLAFSRQHAVESQVVDLGEVVTSTVKMLGRVLGEDVAVVVQRAAEPTWIEVAPGQIEQILMNLTVNARDAMPEGGHLTIGTKCTTLSPTDAARHNGVAPGPYVVLSVSDDGIGMDGPTKERIFEPFFTTKEQDKGTGLGLSTVFGILRQCGGYITVESEPARGATFHLSFPRKDPRDVSVVGATAMKKLQGEATILLVEDDDQVRNLVEKLLSRRGYRVISARGAVEATSRWAELKDSIDLLVTDVIMPGLRGSELAKRLHEDRPSLRVLYMSGYTDDLVLGLPGSDATWAFLQKPLTGDVLTRTVEDLLQAPSSSRGTGSSGMPPRGFVDHGA
jgi:two-component system cell cycle sensor histidine kinase/response regulator CckA